MIASVKGSVNGKTNELKHIGGNLYEIEQTAPTSSARITDEDTFYPVTIVAEDEAGNKTVDSSHLLRVVNNFDFRFIVADAAGKELGYINDAEIDVDIGDTNDFELTISTEEWETGKYGYGHRIFIPETEYGGLVEDMKVITKSDSVLLKGYTWRGLLTQKIVEPPIGQAYLILNGELNEVLHQLIDGRFGELFTVDDTDTGIQVKNWQVDRYAVLYAVLIKLLVQHNHRLDIRYIQGEQLEAGKVHICAAQVADHSDELEYSQDAGIDFDIQDFRRGINHLICGGAGELEDRLILHLYVQQDGSIGYTPYYTGLAERTAFYDDNNADTLEKLEEEGGKRLKELQNYKKMQMFIDNIDLEVGDIVGGREYITGTELKKPVEQKIFRQKNGQISIEYKLKGED